MTSFFLPLFTLVVAWVLWRVLRPFFIVSPLDNIPGPAPPSIVKGNLTQLYDRHGWKFLDSLGNKYNKVVKLQGLFGRRMLYVFDPTALHQIIVKETDAYPLPESFLDMMNMSLGPGLVAVHGLRHRKQRRMLNPVFSIKHMRSLTPIFYGVAHKLANGLEAEVGITSATVNALDWFSRTALELIGQGGLGHSLDTLEKPEPNPLGGAIKEFSPKIFELSNYQSLAKYVKKLGPPRYLGKLIDMLPVAKLRDFRRIIMKMHSESVIILAKKRAALQAGDDEMTRAVGEGKDIMSVLLHANMAASEEDRLPEDEVLGQMNLLVLAATDTTSSALTATLDILGHRLDIQEKLRAEIDEAQEKCGNNIPYDTLVALPYLDAICREILRLFPPVSTITREARQDVVMPLSKPIVVNDGNVMKRLLVPAGTELVIGIRSINRDKTIWGDDAEEFRPERWLSPLPSSVLDARVPGVYANLMTFNGGGRACIGFKFSQLEMKVVLSTIVSKFKVSLADNADEVYWNMAGIRYPTVGKYSDKPRYPVKLERIRAKA